MSFVVPVASTQRTISRDAARLIYEFGAASNVVLPWNDPNSIFQRSAASGTQSMIAKAIGAPPAAWFGIAATGSGDMVNKVGAQTGLGLAEKTIGILSTDNADNNRSSLAILAYQHKGQSCSYWPDSTNTSFDKVNVRDGHYPIWGALHMYANVNGDGTPVSSAVAALVTYLAVEAPPLASVQAQIDAREVPHCAMKVKRTAEIGAYTPYKPTMPCGCYFERRVGSTNNSCVACSDTMPCGAGTVCSYGYCEAM
jgi:hypothetical protein